MVSKPYNFDIIQVCNFWSVVTPSFALFLLTVTLFPSLSLSLFATRKKWLFSPFTIAVLLPPNDLGEKGTALSFTLKWTFLDAFRDNANVSSATTMALRHHPICASLKCFNFTLTLCLLCSHRIPLSFLYTFLLGYRFISVENE